MVTTLRIEDGLKRDCEAVFGDLGLNLSTAITLFLRQVVKQRGIPFALTCDRRRDVVVREFSDAELRKRGMIAKRFFSEMRDECDEDMSLDDINAEIAAARAERHARERAHA